MNDNIEVWSSGLPDIQEGCPNISEDFNNFTSKFCPSVTDTQIDLLLVFSFLLEGVLQMVISMLGVLGNIASIFILTRPELRSCFNKLLAVLASYDLLYLITMLLESLRRLGLETNPQILMFPYILYPLNSIAMTGSIFMTVGVATERYIAVYYPLYYHKILTDTTSHRGHLLTYLLPITFFAVLFNIPKFFESKVSYDGDGNIFVDITELRTNHLYIIYYHNWLRLMIIGILPFAAISFLNFKIYMVVRRRRNGRRNKDEHLSLILIMIVITFVFCNIPQLLLNMHEIFVLDSIELCMDSLLGGFPIWSIFVGFISHVFLVINSSANLFIYCIIDPKFRNQFCKYFFLTQSVNSCPTEPESPEGMECRQLRSQLNSRIVEGAENL